MGIIIFFTRYLSSYLCAGICNKVWNFRIRTGRISSLQIVPCPFAGHIMLCINDSPMWFFPLKFTRTAGLITVRQHGSCQKQANMNTILTRLIGYDHAKLARQKGNRVSGCTRLGCSYTSTHETDHAACLSV